MITAEFITRAEQALESEQPETSLEALKRECRSGCETNYIQGLIYRVRAVAVGTNAGEKVKYYQQASDAFYESAAQSPQSVRELILARHYENLGFVNLVQAGIAADVSARLSLYRRSVDLLDHAITLFPLDYVRNRRFLTGWKYLTEGKVNALLSDESDDLQEKIHYQRAASQHYAQSAQEFAGNNQSNLSMISSAWETYAQGWCLVFEGEITEGSEKLVSAKSIFESAHRNDLAEACQIHIDQLREVKGFN
jgi:tetratricopeptide (TPR) repeat protein